MKRPFQILVFGISILSLCCTQILTEFTVSAEELPSPNGQCGNNLYWEYSEGTLTISGEGKSMYDRYTANEEGCPWYPFQSDITSLVIEQDCGLTRILSNTFSNYSNMTNVTLSPQIKYIDKAAIYKTNITEVYIPDSVIYISPYNFGYYTEENGKSHSDCTVYGKANSAASNYCFDTGCTFSATAGTLQSVSVSADTWNFENTPKFFETTAGGIGSYMTEEHLAAFKANSTNTDYAYGKQLIYNYWVGSCIGMSSLLTLCHNGVISPSDIQAGAETVNDIQINPGIESLMNYYSVMLNGYAGYNFENNLTEYKTDAERTQILLEYGQKAHDEETAFLVISRCGGTAHALVGIDMISGEWEFDDITYDTCVQMIDPNFADQASMGSSVFINTQTGYWIQPCMSMGNTDNLRYGTIACTSSPDTLNYRGLIGGNHEYDENQPKYTEIQFLAFESDNTTLELTDSNGNTLFEWSDKPSGNRNVGEFTAYPAEDTVTFHRTLAKDSDILSTATMKVMGYDYYYITSGNGAEYMTISPDTVSFEISEWAAEHNDEVHSLWLCMTFDEERFNNDFSWDTVSVKIKDNTAENGSITQRNDGFILSGGMLKDAAVSLKKIKTEEEISTIISTDEKSVFVTCENDTVLLLTDPDGDGIYDTPLDAEPDNTEIDIYNINFATYILSYYAKNGSGIDTSEMATEKCDTNNDGFVDICDAANVLSYYAECSAGLINEEFAAWIKSK